jgi:hypothetical protein
MVDAKQRAGHRSERAVGAADVHANADTYANPDTNSDAHTNADAYANADSDTNAYAGRLPP